MTEYTMYIIVNNDLKMSKGKIASQVGHIVESIAEKIVSAMYEQDNEINDKTQINFLKYRKNGHKKIVLKGTEKDIRKLMKSDDAMYIIDEGRTEIPKDSLTVIGFYPSNNKERFKGFRLL